MRHISFLARFLSSANRKNVNRLSDGLCSADVMSVLRTTDETIYCYCYGGGLCKLVSSNLLSDELRFRSFGKETSPLARALIEDKNHNIWIGSETDITLFDAVSYTHLWFQ